MLNICDHRQADFYIVVPTVQHHVKLTPRMLQCNATVAPRLQLTLSENVITNFKENENIVQIYFTILAQCSQDSIK